MTKFKDFSTCTISSRQHTMWPPGPPILSIIIIDTCSNSCMYAMVCCASTECYLCSLGSPTFKGATSQLFAVYNRSPPNLSSIIQEVMSLPGQYYHFLDNTHIIIQEVMSQAVAASMAYSAVVRVTAQKELVKVSYPAYLDYK